MLLGILKDAVIIGIVNMCRFSIRHSWFLPQILLSSVIPAEHVPVSEQGAGIHAVEQLDNCNITSSLEYLLLLQRDAEYKENTPCPHTYF